VRLSALEGCFATPQSLGLFEAFRLLDLFDVQPNALCFSNHSNQVLLISSLGYAEPFETSINFATLKKGGHHMGAPRLLL
jgi:hypothetical protein